MIQIGTTPVNLRAALGMTNLPGFLLARVRCFNSGTQEIRRVDGLTSPALDQQGFIYQSGSYWEQRILDDTYATWLFVAYESSTVVVEIL